MWSTLSKEVERCNKVRAVTDHLTVLKYILNMKEGHLRRMMFSISRLESVHKVSFIKVSL